MCEVLNGISIRIRRIHTKIQAELVSYKLRSLNRITAFVFVICAPLYLRIVCVRSAVSIYPSLYCVVPDLFVSLSMPFVVLVLFSVRGSFPLSFVTCFSDLVRLLLRYRRTPTGTVAPSLDRGIDIQWIQMDCDKGSFLFLPASTSSFGFSRCFLLLQFCVAVFLLLLPCRLDYQLV